MSNLKSRIKKIEQQVNTPERTDPRWQTLRAWREKHPSSYGDDNLYLILLDVFKSINPLDDQAPAPETVAAMRAGWELYQDDVKARGGGTRCFTACDGSDANRNQAG